MSLERGLDGRALPIEVRAGNVFFLDPETGTVPPFAPTFADPFTGFILPGAGASGINIIDNTLENPTVQQFNLGTRFKLPGDARAALDYVHNRGTHFIIGRPIGEVFNPVVGGPDRVVNLESSVGTRYDALLASLEKRWGSGQQLRLSYTPGERAQLRERRPDPVRQRARSTRTTSSASTARPRTSSGTASCSSGSFLLPLELRLSGDLDDRLRRADGHPDARRLEPRADAVAQRRRARVQDRRRAQRVHHVAQRERRHRRRAAAARGRRRALQRQLRRRSTCACRAASRSGASLSLEAIVECFNVFNVTNILGVSNTNYSGFSNVLVRDSSDPPIPASCARRPSAAR